MTAKEYLNQAYWLDRRINSKLEQISALRETATKATSVMNDTPVSHSRNVQSMQETIAKIVDMEHELDREIDALVDLKREITQIIKSVPSFEYKTILELRYLTFKSWSEIATLMNYDVRYVYKMHGRALKKIDELLERGQ